MITYDQLGLLMLNYDYSCSIIVKFNMITYDEIMVTYDRIYEFSLILACVYDRYIKFNHFRSFLMMALQC